MTTTRTRPALVSYSKHGQVWLVHYDRMDPKPALVKLGQWACRGDLDFTWYDAALVGRRIRLRAVTDGVVI